MQGGIYLSALDIETFPDCLQLLLINSVLCLQQALQGCPPHLNNSICTYENQHMVKVPHLCRGNNYNLIRRLPAIAWCHLSTWQINRDTFYFKCNPGPDTHLQITWDFHNWWHHLFHLCYGLFCPCRMHHWTAWRQQVRTFGSRNSLYIYEKWNRSIAKPLLICKHQMPL